MPTSADIEKIADSFGLLYGVDVSKVRQDTEKLKKIIAGSGERAIDPSEIYSDSLTFNTDQDSALLADLETFELSDVAPDPRLFDSRVEQTLDEAARYTDFCLQTRRQYTEMGKLRNDTRFKFEEFFRLDLVHEAEVSAGLYQLPLQQAVGELESLRQGIATADLQLSAIDAMYSDGNILSDSEDGKFVEATNGITRATANDDKNKIAAWSEVVTKRRTGLDKATWAQSKMAAAGSRAQQNARLSAADQKAQYFGKDVGFRTQRALISKQLAWLQVQEHARANSALNYEERLSNLRALFEVNLRYLIQRVWSLGRGLKSYYGIETSELVAKKGGILDEVALWIPAVQDAFCKYKRAQRVAIWSRTTQVTIGKNGFESAFSVEDAALPAGRPLLRGVAFEFAGTYGGPITLRVTAPSGATPFSNPEVLFGRVGPFAPGLELKPQQSDLFWNGLASGTWKIEWSVEGGGTIDRIIIHLWLAIQ